MHGVAIYVVDVNIFDLVAAKAMQEKKKKLELL